MENDFGLKASFSFVMGITGVASISYFFLEKKTHSKVLVTQAFMMVKQIRLTSGILQVGQQLDIQHFLLVD